MEKDEKSFVLHSTIKALSQMIPIIGGAFSSLYGDVLADIEKKRVGELLEGLRLDLEANIDRINHQFINKEDFLDLLVNAKEKVRRERSEVKRLGFKNILAKGITNEKPNYDEIENNLNLLNQLTADHVYLLKLFSDPLKLVQEAHINPEYTAQLQSLFTTLFYYWELDYTIDLLFDLEGHRLISPIIGEFENMTISRTYDTLKTFLTKRGAKFIGYVVR